MDENMTNSLRAKLEGMSYPELAEELQAAKSAHADAKTAATALNEIHNFIARQYIPERMDKDQIQNITVAMSDGMNRRLQTRGVVSVKTPPENKLDLWNWLRENEAEAIITETVNASTLSSFIGQQMKNGDPVPHDICNIEVYDVASLVKA